MPNEEYWTSGEVVIDQPVRTKRALRKSRVSGLDRNECEHEEPRSLHWVASLRVKCVRKRHVAP
jgi:hypothetical protein